MKTTRFGEPRPVGAIEMQQALDERELDEDEGLHAILERCDDDGFGSAGWTAEVRTDVAGEEVFTTLAYANQHDLQSDLRSVGITDIEVKRD